jgi:hypothetical protein
MLRLLIDQDLDHVILRGLILRVPNLDVITAIIGLSNASDPEVLAWLRSKSEFSLRTTDAQCPITASRIARVEKVAGCHRGLEATAPQPSDQ